MKNSSLKRLLCFLMAVSMVLSITVMPAAATGETTAEAEHTCVFTTETARTEATCGDSGSVTRACTCGKTETQEIPATGAHNYENGVCTGCTQNKPCTLELDCDAPQHVEQCLSQASCTCIRQCSETMACPVCESHGQCKGGEAEERIAAVQVLIDALPSQYNLSEAAAVKQQYDACTASIEALDKHEFDALDLTRYYAAANPTVIDDVNVAFIGTTGFPTLAEAITAAENNAVITLKAGKYTLPTLTKHLTFQAADGVAAKDVVFDLGSSSHSGSGVSVNVAFTGVTLERPTNTSYQGFHHAASETYTNCIIKGQYWTYGTTATFTGCSFETDDAANYNICTYGTQNITFTNCTFKCAGKSVLIYNEGGNGTNASFTGCSFTATAPVEGKAAIELDSSLLKNNMVYSVTIDNATTATGFATGSVSGKPLWNNKKGSLAEVTVGSRKELTIKPTAESLPLLVSRGGTIKLEESITLTEPLTIPAGKTVTLDLNGKTLSQTKDQSDTYAMIINKGTLTIQDSGTDGKISYADSHAYTSAVNYASNTIRNEGKLYVKSGTIENTSNEATAKYGYPHAIDCYAGSELYIEGGTVSCPSYTAVRMFCVSSGDTAVTISDKAKVVGNIDFHNVNGEANKGSLTVTGGTMDRIRLLAFGSDFGNMTASISGGTIENVTCSNYIDAEAVKAEKSLQYLNQVFTITGGTFENDISSLLTAQYTQNESGAVVKATPTVSVPKVESSIDQQTATQQQKDTISAVSGNTAASTANSTVANTLTGKIDGEDMDAAVNKLMENTTVKDQTDTKLEVTLKMEVTKVPQAENKSSITSITYDISPIVQVVKGEGTDKEVLASEPITELNNEITITIPVPFDVKYVNLKHTHKEGEISITTDKGDIAVQGEHPNKYITYTTSKFSELELTPKTGTAPVAKVGNAQYTDIADAIAAVNANGGTMQLLTDVTTGTSVTIPADKTASIDLNGKKYTYEGTNAAFVNNGTSLTLSGGSVVANTGTLVKSAAGTLSISNVTYTSTNANGYSIEVTNGTATIASGTFSGNAYSVYASGSGAAMINGGTFNKGVKAASAASNVKNITIAGGSFNALDDTATTTVNEAFCTESGTIYIPGTSAAHFKANPPAAMIETNYEAVPVSGMYKIQEKPYVVVGPNPNDKHHYATGENLDTVFKNNQSVAAFKIFRNEELKENHNAFSASETAIDFGGKLIYGGGSISAGTSKTIYLNNIGPNNINVTLKSGDKATFGTDGTVTITAAENVVNGKAVGYGDILMTVKNTSGTETAIKYFLGTQGALIINPTGSQNTTGHVVPASPTADAPSYSLNVKDNESNIFVIGSNKDMIFETNAFPNTLTGVWVNGLQLATNAYSLSNSETTITLNNKYLKSLTTKGKYELTVQFLDGETKTANFYVYSTAKPVWNPQTGDMIMRSVIVMAVAAAGLAALWYIGKKKKK